MEIANKSSVVAILYPGCIFFEIAGAIDLLTEKCQIIFATPDGSDHVPSKGPAIRATMSYEEIDLTNCRAVLIPGGDPRSIIDNKVVDKVLQAANTKGLCLAAICAGPSVLAKAGVLKGKRIAHGYGPKQLEFLKSYFEGVHLTEDKLICDGNVITAKPDAHIEFAAAIADHLEAGQETI